MSVVKTKVYHADADIHGILVSGQVPVPGINGWDEVPTGQLVIREISGENTSPLNEIYVQIYDMDVAPVDGATNMRFSPIRVAANTRFDIVFDKELYPMSFIIEHGLYIAASSTKYTLTHTIGLDGMDIQVLFDEKIN